MWARTIEFMLAIWLGISWIIFDYDKSMHFLFYHDFSYFILIAFFSLLSNIEKLRHIHLFNFAVGLWLIYFSYYLRGIGFDSYAQNHMVIALLLLILSIIPSHAGRPPYQWIKFLIK